MSEKYTEEEQQLIDKLKEEQDKYDGQIGSDFRELTFNLFGREFQSKTFDMEKFKLFWSIFGQVPTAAIKIGETAVRAFKEGFLTPTTYSQSDETDYPITLSKYLIRVETIIGRQFEDLDPSEQEAILLGYETLKTPGFELELDSVTNDVNLIIEMALQNKLPEELDFVSNEIVSQSTVSDYSSQAEAAYLSYLSKTVMDDIYKEIALKNTDEKKSIDLLEQLKNDEINSQEYIEAVEQQLKELDVDVEGFLNAMSGGEIAPQTELTEMIDDEFLRVKAFTLGADNYYGLGDVDLQGPVYSDTDKVPLYEYGLARQLFANASAEEIMEVQLMLVEAGFLKPFSFVYGVLDNNDGGTIQALESAMSRFNLNGDTVTRQDLLSIMMSPGAQAQNLTVFVKEFMKDTLEDYAFGTGQFEASDSYGVNYNDVFTYIKPNFNNAKSTIAAAIERGLGRPASTTEIQAYVDYVNKVSYDLQKENFAINQRNINKQIAAERQREQAARTGRPYTSDVVLEQPMSAESIGQSIYSGFSDFLTEQYGGLLEGDQKSALYNNAFINMLNSMSNLGRYSQGG